jgi:membrane-associated phospholipid phosphatase
MMTNEPTIRRMTRTSRTRRWILTGIWLLLFCVAIAFDRTVAQAVHDSGIDATIRRHWRIAETVKLPGTFAFTAAVAILWMLLRQITGPQSLFIALAGVMSGINGLIKWLVGRTRPFKLPGTDELQPFHFEPFWHGTNGLFHQKDLCFPSGHACTAFALAAAVTIVRPRWGWLFIPLAVMVGIERVLENAHYFSDVVGAAGIGAAGALLVWRLLRRWLEPSPEPSGFPVIPQPANPETATVHP